MMDLATILQGRAPEGAAKVEVGDTVKVHVKVVEASRERTQLFEGVVIRLHAPLRLDGTFTVRRVAHGIGVERTFPVASPRVEKIEVMRHGRYAARSSTICVGFPARPRGCASDGPWGRARGGRLVA